jgi:hypothetical protein
VPAKGQTAMTTILMLISLVPDWVWILILFTICLSFLVR